MAKKVRFRTPYPESGKADVFGVGAARRKGMAGFQNRSHRKVSKGNMGHGFSRRKRSLVG